MANQKEYITEALVRKEIVIVCNKMAKFLIAKNASYGNSAINPARIFSKADKTEQIKARIDDKLNRIMQGQSYDEDAPWDLHGYLVLLRVAERLQKRSGVAGSKGRKSIRRTKSRG